MSPDNEMSRQVAAEVPPMPVPQEPELWVNYPFKLIDGFQYSIGWQRWTDARGGPGFVTLRRGAVGGMRIVNRYPMTAEGWARAWQELAALDPAVAARVRHVLAERTAKENDFGQSVGPTTTGRVIPARSSPEVRARVLQLIKQADPKYAKPFEKDRLAGVSLFGTESWAEYGQVVLQMAILDTLLSIEELLRSANGADGTGVDDER